MFDVLLNARHLKKEYSGMFYDSQAWLDILLLTQVHMKPTHQNIRKQAVTLCFQETKALLQHSSIQPPPQSLQKNRYLSFSSQVLCIVFFK